MDFGEAEAGKCCLKRSKRGRLYDGTDARNPALIPAETSLGQESSIGLGWELASSPCSSLTRRHGWMAKGPAWSWLQTRQRAGRSMKYRGDVSFYQVYTTDAVCDTGDHVAINSLTPRDVFNGSSVLLLLPLSPVSTHTPFGQTAYGLWGGKSLCHVTCEKLG